MFAKPAVGAAPGKAGGWELEYRHVLKPHERPPRGFEQATVVVSERSSAGVARGSYRGGQEVVIGGNNVSLLQVAGAKNGYAGRWKTAAALYTVLDNGLPESGLRKFIACFP